MFANAKGTERTNLFPPAQNYLSITIHVPYGSQLAAGGGASYLAPLPLRRVCGDAISSERHRVDHVRWRDQTGRGQSAEGWDRNKFAMERFPTMMALQPGATQRRKGLISVVRRARLVTSPREQAMSKPEPFVDQMNLLIRKSGAFPGASDDCI
jgi:hypothetical protein